LRRRITEIKMPTDFCLMDSVRPLVVALFNREASLDFALDTSAYSMIVIKTKKALNKIAGNELNALVLDPQDDFDWAAPQGIVYEALKMRGEDMRKALETRIHSAALNLAARDQQGRASGIAKFRDFGPIAILLEMYGEVLRAAIEEMVQKLIDLRGDTDSVTFEVMGLNEFDLQALDAKMELITAFMALPTTETARRWVMGDLEQSMLADAPPEIREKAQIENEEMEMPAMGASAEIMTGQPDANPTGNSNDANRKQAAKQIVKEGKTDLVE
jgi:hypothetical protein